MKTRPSAFRIPHSAFTLVELLVVIGIIAALAALLLVAAAGARSGAQERAIQAEISSIDSAFIEYTNDRSGGAYPPNLLTAQHIGGSGPTNQPNTMKESVYNDFKRHFNKAFPKHREPPQLLGLLAGVQVNNSGQFVNGLNNSDSMYGGLNPYEAVVFWLGGFSDDPKYPISGPGGPSFVQGANEDFSSRTPIFDFEVTRLGPRNDANQFSGRWFTYDVVLNGTPQTRRINLWMYAPDNRTLPLAYFHAPKNPKLDPVFKLNYDDNNEPGKVAIKQLKLNPQNPATIGDLRYANEGKCQVLSAGLDDDWGTLAASMGVNYPAGSTTAASPILLYPEGPFTQELADTITNFSTNATLEDSQP